VVVSFDASRFSCNYVTRVIVICEQCTVDMNHIRELLDERLTVTHNSNAVLSGERVSQMTKTYSDVDAVQKLLEEVGSIKIVVYYFNLIHIHNSK